MSWKKVLVWFSRQNRRPIGLSSGPLGCRTGRRERICTIYPGKKPRPENIVAHLQRRPAELRRLCKGAVPYGAGHAFPLFSGVADGRPRPEALVSSGPRSQSLELPPSMPGHAYPPVPATAIGFGRARDRGHKDSIPEYTVEVPSLAYSPNARGPSYDGDKEVGSVDVRAVLRTPSPTPSEAQVLASKTTLLGDWRRHLDWRRYANRRGMTTIAAVVGALLFVILFLVEQKKIVAWLQPFAHWMHDTPGGWVIPIAIMFVLSFPPLFGHEIIAVVCGDVWGVWIGFGIVAAGTLLGELGNFYAFKWFCSARGKRFEEKRLTWGLYAQVVREGGLVVPTIMRLTFIPGHLLTAIFSTCGMTVWGFFVSATLSLPKQLAVVYLGVAQNSGENQSTTSGIKAVVILATLAMTIVAMRHVNKKVDQVKGKVIYARQKARQAKMLRGEEPLPLDEELALRPTAPQDPSQKLPARASSSTGADAGGVAIHMPAPQRPAKAGRGGVGRLFGGRKKNESDVGLGGGSGGVDVNNIVEVELGDRHELRARRHTDDVQGAQPVGVRA
ncbi:Golgi apparatus membrane protein TVP38 [Trametes pubescens]|uniref:Golgi apparatus membrane protein TVP38 n=1 Tax=Trametes pubescens TaxID=154538 RepID=A0A1M2VE15_TRAPU|nr:Golgi apparatus membrane protein TVP38 [Trametes pubescens]